MAAKYYLRIPEIDGESTDRDHACWIDIESVDLGSGKGQRGSGTGGTGITLTDVTLSKKLDKASPDLFRAMATGRNFPKVTLEGTKQQHKFIEYVFDKVLISSFTAERGTEYELFTLIFEKATFQYS